MIRIAICDDDVHDIENIRMMIDRWQDIHGKTVRLSVYESGNALLNDVQDGSEYDMYILDVLMPGMNGIELGTALRKEDAVSSGRSLTDNVRDRLNEKPIIYLTSSPEFAIESYEVRAFFYMLKPVSYEKFDMVITDVTHLIEQSASAAITVRTKSGTYSVRYGEICYLELARRTVHYMCMDRELYSVTVQGAFRDYISQLLSDKRFIMCGASILVNLEHIKSIEKSDLVFTGGQALHIPRDSSKTLHRAWLDFWLDGGDI